MVTDSPPPQTHILIVHSLPKKETKGTINKVKDIIIFYFQIFYIYCDNIVIVNCFGHDNRAVKI